MTPEHLFQQEVCICNHLLHLDDDCYELNFNGTIYSACLCTKSKCKVKKMVVKTTVNEDELISEDNGESAETAETTDTTETLQNTIGNGNKLQWGSVKREAVSNLPKQS